MKNVIAIATITLLLLQTLYPTLAWNLERPADEINIRKRTENSCTNCEAAVGLGVYIDDYNVDGSDYVNLNVSMTANSRVGITYSYNWYSLDWIDETQLHYKNSYAGVGDDWGTWVNFPPDASGGPSIFRFYGGPGSAEYDKVWICSNGFIAFDDSNLTTPTPPYNIPYNEKPNALIAALWTDLKVDNNAEIITGQHVSPICNYYFVIIWKNVLHKSSGERLTFQIVLEDAPEYYPADRRYAQSNIWISYKSVSAINTHFAVGIEDQQGEKGTGWLYAGSQLQSFNGYTLQFYRYASSYFLKSLTLTFEDTNPNTEFDIDEDFKRRRGYHIENIPGETGEPDTAYRFIEALTGTATLLIDAISLVANPPAWVAAAGFMISATFVTLDLASLLAYNQYSHRQIEVLDRDDSIKQTASATALTYDYVVDASLSIEVQWILMTPRTEHHKLTITAKLEYYEYTVTGETIEKTITTSVLLEIGPDDNDNAGSADTISEGWYHMLYIGGYDENDYYKIYLEKDHSFYVYLEETSSDKANINIYVYDPNGIEKAYKTLYRWLGPPYTNLTLITDKTGYWCIQIELRGGQCFYTLKINTAG